ncbi:hypothetical protein HNR23_003822 [Nocardiopsis mwathae]|uniref:Uncharacterized protein n=1 Tax=Nocardiopsis mwathae TaxID=1472723 RepID=A0A7X0D6P2_9ACTN|nr:hypothetical protein [Nocardiopsis mwathae]MBB6173762.1 hypothetical protein [Nocardiopsis mwathae]
MIDDLPRSRSALLRERQLERRRNGMLLAGGGLLTMVLLFFGAVLAALDFAPTANGPGRDAAPRDASISELQGNEEGRGATDPSADPGVLKVDGTAEVEGEKPADDSSDPVEPDSAPDSSPDPSRDAPAGSAPQQPETTRSEESAVDSTQPPNPETPVAPAPASGRDDSGPGPGSGHDADPAPTDDDGADGGRCTTWWLFC